MEYSCFECHDRHPGCHADCPKYQAERKEQLEKKRQHYIDNVFSADQYMSKRSKKEFYRYKYRKEHGKL